MIGRKNQFGTKCCLILRIETTELLFVFREVERACSKIVDPDGPVRGLLLGHCVQLPAQRVQRDHRLPLNPTQRRSKGKKCRTDLSFLIYTYIEMKPLNIMTANFSSTRVIVKLSYSYIIQ